MKEFYPARASLAQRKKGRPKAVRNQVILLDELSYADSRRFSRPARVGLIFVVLLVVWMAFEQGAFRKDEFEHEQSGR